ncbi:uncharacterized protein LOC123477391 isoform X2 [Daphnia magna]|uniref:uncharacterized protein LOC123477391 isoform X2 n=1 Tax=Daphnia magna TaxID=35525 RepID=UPI001E1BB354|nr:uncharacterized protein LOC123477391 isoform X2 [Daphnia magna]
MLVCSKRKLKLILSQNKVKNRLKDDIFCRCETLKENYRDKIIIFIHFPNAQDTPIYCNTYGDVALDHVLIFNDFGEKFYEKCCVNSAKATKQIDNGFPDKSTIEVSNSCTGNVVGNVGQTSPINVNPTLSTMAHSPGFSEVVASTADSSIPDI